MVDVFIALIGLLGTIATGGFAVWKLKIKKPKQFSNHFKVVSEILTQLNAAVEKAGAKRAVILVLENGGGVPTLRSPIYSSILYEACRSDKSPIQANWQRRLCDTQYLENMRRVHHAAGRPYVFKYDDFKGSDLEFIYRDEGVKASQVAELKQTDLFYMYCSFNYDTPYSELTDAQKIAGHQIIATLQNLIKEIEC